MRILLLIGVIVISSAGAAGMAQAQNSPGLNYIVTNDKNRTPPKPSTMMQSLSTSSNQAKSTDETVSEQAAQNAWETYKALASGTDKPIVREVPKPKAPHLPETSRLKPLAPPPPVMGTGITGLLQDYQRTKEQRGRMNTLVINPRSGE